MTEFMLGAVEKTGLEKIADIFGCNRAIGHTPLCGFHFDQRLEIKHAARAVADDLHIFLELLGFGRDGRGNLVGADR